MNQAPRAGTETTLLGYADIAELLGVSVQTARYYASQDKDFPSRITPASMRSPGFDPEDVRRYIETRNTKNVGKPGRPPRTARQGDRVSTTDASLPDRIRAAVASETTSVKTLTELAGKLGLSSITFGNRMRGTTRWTEGELKALRKILKISVDHE